MIKKIIFRRNDEAYNAIIKKGINVSEFKEITIPLSSKVTLFTSFKESVNIDFSNQLKDVGESGNLVKNSRGKTMILSAIQYVLGNHTNNDPFIITSNAELKNAMSNSLREENLPNTFDVSLVNENGVEITRKIKFNPVNDKYKADENWYVDSTLKISRNEFIDEYLPLIFSNWPKSYFGKSLIINKSQETAQYNCFSTKNITPNQYFTNFLKLQPIAGSDSPSDFILFSNSNAKWTNDYTSMARDLSIFLPKKYSDEFLSNNLKDLFEEFEIFISEIKSIEKLLKQKGEKFVTPTEKINSQAKELMSLKKIIDEKEGAFIKIAGHSFITNKNTKNIDLSEINSKNIYDYSDWVEYKNALLNLEKFWTSVNSNNYASTITKLVSVLTEDEIKEYNDRLKSLKAKTKSIFDYFTKIKSDVEKDHQHIQEHKFEKIYGSSGAVGDIVDMKYLNFILDEYPDMKAPLVLIDSMSEKATSMENSKEIIELLNEIYINISDKKIQFLLANANQNTVDSLAEINDEIQVINIENLFFKQENKGIIYRK